MKKLLIFNGDFLSSLLTPFDHGTGKFMNNMSHWIAESGNTHACMHTHVRMHGRMHTHTHPHTHTHTPTHTHTMCISINKLHESLAILLPYQIYFIRSQSFFQQNTSTCRPWAWSRIPLISNQFPCQRYVDLPKPQTQSIGSAFEQHTHQDLEQPLNQSLQTKTAHYTFHAL